MKRLDEFLVELAEAHGLEPPTCGCIGEDVCHRCCEHPTVACVPVPCPDGRPGCLVAHFADRCVTCGAIE